MNEKAILFSKKPYSDNAVNSKAEIAIKIKSNTLFVNDDLDVTYLKNYNYLTQKIRFKNSANKKTLKQAWRFFLIVLFNGDPERIRTSNRQSRNLIFYPVELLGQKHLYYRCCIVIFFNLIDAPLQVYLWFFRLPYQILL